MLPLAGHTCWPLKASASARGGPEPPSWHPAAGRSQLMSPARNFSLCDLQYCTPKKKKKKSEATAASPTLTEPSCQSHNQTLAVPWRWQEALPPNTRLQVGRGECSRYQHEVLTTLSPGPCQPLSFSRIPTSPPNPPQPSSRTAAHPGQPHPLRLTRTSCLKTRHHPIKTPFNTLSPLPPPPFPLPPAQQGNSDRHRASGPPCPLSPLRHRPLPDGSPGAPSCRPPAEPFLLHVRWPSLY